MDIIIKERLSKITQHLQHILQNRSIHDISVIQHDNYIDIILNKIQASVVDDRSLKIVNMINRLPQNLKDGLKLSNELSDSLWKIRININLQVVQKSLNRKAVNIIQSILNLNNIPAFTLPISSNRFIVIPLQNKFIDMKILFQNINQTNFYLVNTDFPTQDSSLTDTILLPFLLDPTKKIPVYKQQLLNDHPISKVYFKFNPHLQAYSICVIFDSFNKTLLHKITQQNISKNMAIAVNNTVISIPKIVSPIDNGEVMINGNFTLQQAKDLTNLLSLNYIPIGFTVISSRSSK